MDLGLNGKKVLICAASRGLGKATALALASEGVELFVCSRSEDSLKEMIQEAKTLTNAPVHSAACDLVDQESRQALIDKVKVEMGHVDILIHNVGGPPPTTAEDTSLAQWEEGFNRLFMSVAHLNEAFLPQMKVNQWGRIAIITSSSVYEPVPGLAISNAFRAATTNMAKTLASEVASYGVTVNCVAPGVIYTARTEERIKAAIVKSGGSHDEYMKKYTAEIPMGRLGDPDEYAAALTFICSEKASYITGHTLPVDGGKRKSTV